jgi:hypothetical protein
MACDLTTGRAKACFDQIGGLKSVYFTTDDLGAITYDITDTDVITAFAGTPDFFQFDLKGNANTFVETITKDVNNGTSFFDQVLTVQFPKLDKETHKELKLLVYASPTVVVEDFNGNQFVMGLVNKADANGGTIETGGARGDFAGYKLTMNAQEPKPASFLDSDIASAGGTVSAVQIAP